MDVTTQGAELRLSVDVVHANRAGPGETGAGIPTETAFETERRATSHGEAARAAADADQGQGAALHFERTQTAQG